MSMPQIRPASGSDTQTVLDVLMFAFAADPFARYMGPDSAQYLKSGAIFRAMAEASIESGDTCIATNTDGFAGAVSVWFSPGNLPPEDKMTAALEQSVEADRLETVAEVFEAMEKFHPDQPHWYLALLGADAHFQGQGLGSALLKHTLSVCDQAGKPAYLESSNPRNISVYERHGFEVMDEIRIGDCPVITPMLRTAR